MRTVLYDIDSKIPNLALMKISSWYKNKGYEVILTREAQYIEADAYYASTVFYIDKSHQKVDELKSMYGDSIVFGGTGVDLKNRLPEEIDACFPDYSIYAHHTYALGFLTRGCVRKCPFCVVPEKEGKPQIVPGGFNNFVPYEQHNVMLLDDNLLCFPEAERFLEEMITREYVVNFSQSLDISYLDEQKFRLLKRVHSCNARFTKKMYYFSCNNVKTTEEFISKKDLLKAFGEDSVSVLIMFGFNTRLSDDYRVLFTIRRLKLIPFLIEYHPIPGVPARIPADYFDMDLNKVIKLTFRSNGQNWEKYLRWLNRKYYNTFGKYYKPLVEIIYRYNNKNAIYRYLQHPELLTDELFKDFRDEKHQGYFD
ncbi:hypothetical protein SY88_17820 [Clostridiales bacterium PH28_bin88]|nr:hypothetical protein SY88_17820 [Clostridiales bacterium PH28_bin88]